MSDYDGFEAEKQGISGDDGLTAMGGACHINHIVTNGKFSGATEKYERLINKTFFEFSEEIEGCPDTWLTPFERSIVFDQYTNRTAMCSVSRQGRLMEINKRFYQPMGNNPFFRRATSYDFCSSRGDVLPYMSDKSKWRLKRFLLTLDLSRVAPESMVFTTITFPRHVSDIAIAQNAVRVFLQRLKRSYGVACTWKKEFTRRGRVHYHIFMVFPKKVILGNYFILSGLDCELRPFNRKTKKFFSSAQAEYGLRYEFQGLWAEYIQRYFSVGDKSVFNSGIEVEYVKKPEAIADYLADYLAGDDKKKGRRKDKIMQNTVPDDVVNHGRWWGKTNMKDFVATVEKNVLTYQQYKSFQSYVADLIGKQRVLGEDIHTVVLTAEISESVMEKLKTYEPIQSEIPVSGESLVIQRMRRILRINRFAIEVKNLFEAVSDAVAVLNYRLRKEYEFNPMDKPSAYTPWDFDARDIVKGFDYEIYDIYDLCRKSKGSIYSVCTKYYDDTYGGEE